MSGSASDYGEYAHRAAGAVSDFAGKMRDKSVDDIIDDTRDFVRKSPVVAIGIAAVVGFALMRVIKTGLDDAARPRRRRGLSLDGPAGIRRSESIGDLLGRLVEDGRAYAEAELELVKAIAAYRAQRARRALVALAIGWFLLVTSTTRGGDGRGAEPRPADRRRSGPGSIVGVPLAAGGYVLVSHRLGWRQGARPRPGGARGDRPRRAAP